MSETFQDALNNLFKTTDSNSTNSIKNVQDTKNTTESTTDKVTEVPDTIDWDIQPSKINLNTKNIINDLPDLAELERQSVRHSIEHLFKYSNEIIAQVEQYCIKQNLKCIGINESTTTQSFKIKDKQYLIEKESDIVNIYTIVCDINNIEPLSRSLTKRPFVFKNLLEKESTEHILTLPIFLEIPADIRNSLIEKVISHMFNLSTKEFLNKFEKLNDFPFIKIESKSDISNEKPTHEYHYELPVQSYCTNFGQVLLQYYMLRNHIYNYAELANIQEDFIEMPIKSSEQLLAIILHYSNSPQNINPEFAKIIVIYLKNYLFCNQKNNTEENHKDISSEEKKTLDKYVLMIGAETITWLKKANIFETNTSLQNSQPLLRFVEPKNIALFAATSYNKPLLTPNFKAPTNKFYLMDKIMLEFGLQYNPIPNQSYVNIRPDKRLFEILAEMKRTRMAVNCKDYVDFIELLKTVSNRYSQHDYSAIRYDELTHAFIRAVYNINMKEAYGLSEDKTAVNNNLELCDQLMIYAIDFGQFADENLRLNCKNNNACQEYYNRITSHKYYFRGLLNDLNIYQHFNYFHIPYYVTSTGRVFPWTYYLQLQGNKLVRCFLYFKNDFKITQEKLDVMHTILKQELPNISQEDIPGTINSYESSVPVK
jgi:hypothetical protein